MPAAAELPSGQGERVGELMKKGKEGRKRKKKKERKKKGGEGKERKKGEEGEEEKKKRIQTCVEYSNATN